MHRKSRLSRRELVQYAAASSAALYLGGCATSDKRASSRPAEAAPADAKTWEGLADLSLVAVRKSGAEYGDIRLLDTTRQTIGGEDRRIARINDARDAGFGVRVLYKGAWGFAASALVTADEIRRVTQQAIDVAKASAALVREPVKLVEEPPHVDRVATERKSDPFALTLESKTKLLQDVMETLHKEDGIVRSSASLWAQRDLKYFASTEGARIHFDLLAVQGGISATARADGRFATREYETPFFRSGYELITDADFLAAAPRVASQAVEKCKAPLVEPGQYDMVLDAQHLALTIHESCGHPTELDRALGYEANYAGTTFLTPDKIGKFQYGSRHINIVADNTEPGGLASTGYDDDGVAGQRWDIMREGVFVGCSTNREVAGKIGLKRSTGSSRADSWSSVPIVRIANVGLSPGQSSLDDLIADVKRGIFIEGHGSFSIDQKRYNFQFGGDAFWLIENGKRTHMLRDVIYTGITPEFWNSCDGVADATHRKRYGFTNCGKGQPNQSGWMTHAACPARFRNIKVIAGETRA